MRESQLSSYTNGSFVFWSTGPSRRSFIENGMEALGIKSFTPAETTDSSALKGAMKAQVEGTAKRGKNPISSEVINLKEPKINGFEVVTIGHGEDRNDYSLNFAAKVVDGRIEITRGSTDEQNLREAFMLRKATCSGAAVSAMLVKVLHALAGVTVRENGGLYWIPVQSNEAFDRVISLVEAANCGESKNDIYRVGTVLDAGCIRAVRDAIVKEINEQAEALTESCKHVGLEAIERRKQAAIAMHAKITQYEEVLGVALTTLHESVKIAEEVLVIAEMASFPD